MQVSNTEQVCLSEKALHQGATPEGAVGVESSRLGRAIMRKGHCGLEAESDREDAAFVPQSSLGLEGAAEMMLLLVDRRVI